MNKMFLSVALAMSLAVVAFAQDARDQDLANMPPVLRKFVLSRHTSRFSGVRVVSFKRDGERLEHTEYVLKDGAKNRTEFPDDSPYAGQIIVDNGKERMHFYPDRNEIEVEPARNRDMGRGDNGGEGGDRGGRRRQLTRTVADGGQVAGYSTQEVTVSDSSGNVLQQMWIEPQTGIRLKLVLFDRVGAQQGSFEYTKINFKPTFAPGDFTIDRKGALIVRPPMQARRLAEQYGLTPLVLESNSGFELQNVRVIHPDQKDVLVQSYVGNAGRFAFFQVRGDVEQDRLSRFAHGRLSTYAWKRGDESFALVGSLSQDQMRQIAKTLGDR